MSKRNRRILVTLGVLAGIVAALYAAAPAILAAVAMRMAIGRVDIQELEIESVGLKRVDIAVIRVNHNGTRIDAQDSVVSFEPWPFRIRRIDVGRARVAVAGFPTDADRDEAVVIAPAGLPFDVSINELVVHADTPWGAITVPASLRIGPGESGGSRADILSSEFAVHLRNPAPDRHSLDFLDANETELLTIDAATAGDFPVDLDGRLDPPSIIQWIDTVSVVPAGLKALLASYAVESDSVGFSGSLQQNLDFTARLMGGAVVRDRRGESERLFRSLELRFETGYDIVRSAASWSGSGDAAVRFLPNADTTLTWRHPTWSWSDHTLVLGVTDARLEELAANADTVNITAAGLETGDAAGQIAVDGARAEWWPEDLSHYNVAGNWTWMGSSLEAAGTGTGWALPELKWNVATTGDRGILEVNSSQALVSLTSSLQDYASALAWGLNIKSGDLDGRYRVEWDGGRRRSAVNVTVGPADLDLDEMEVRGLKIVLGNQGDATDRFDLAVSAPRLKLAAGTEAEDLEVKTRLAYPKVLLDAARAHMFGGEISVRPTSFDLDKDKKIELHADLDTISLEKIMALFELESTQLTGDVSGPVRMLFSGERGLEINQGDLHSLHPGVLRFTLAQGSETAAQFNNIAIRALEDFEYRELNATVVYKPNGDYRIAARIVGSNPDVLDGHPIALNPTIEGNLPALFRAFFLTGDFNRAIIEQLQDEGALSTGGETSTFQDD
jgi:hypothetical protein